MASRQRVRKIRHTNVPTIANYLKIIKNAMNQNLNSEVINGLLKDESELLSNIKTISNINEVISRIYKLQDSETTRVLRKLTGFGSETANWDVIFSSANNFDCLIHSFLTATSSNFRKLLQEDKNEFANFFRRGIFLNLPVVLCYSSLEPDKYADIENNIMSKGYLSGTVLLLLAAQFNVQILSARRGDGRNMLQLIDAAAIESELPPECHNWIHNNKNVNDWPIFCIFTNMDHFESIRVNGEFEISEKHVISAMSSLENSIAKWSCNECSTYNPEYARVCNECGTRRVAPTKSQGVLAKPAKEAPKLQSEVNRMCKKCTYENPPSAKICEICELSLKGGTRKAFKKRRVTRKKRAL